MIDEGREPGEQGLRSIFAALRREEHRLAPPFIAPVTTRRESARSRRGAWSPFAVSVCVCVVAILSLLLWPRPRPASGHNPAPPVTSITQWRPPTEFLLETPGNEMLRSTPEFGTGLGTGFGMRPELSSAPARTPQPAPTHAPHHAGRPH